MFTRKLSWKNVSIVKKLYLVVGIMACLIAGELLILRFAMHTLSAARAFVEGEGSWSKAQKNAIFALQRYGISHDEKDFQSFQDFLKVPEGDHRARIEMAKPHANAEIIRNAFLQGRVHPDDIEPMVRLITRFYWISYLSRAIEQWTLGDVMIAEVKQKADLYHEAIQKKNWKLSESTMAEIHDLDRKIGDVEDSFSSALGAGSRWLERVVLSLLLIAVISVESVGLTLAVMTARALSRGLKELDESAVLIGSGNFTQKVPQRSEDEIGRLGGALDKMRRMLQTSYLELEDRVAARTEELKLALAYRDEFLSIASHELKTPLTAMYLQLEILDRKIKSELEGEQKDQMSKQAIAALNRGRSLKKLLDQLFDLTRLNSGKLDLQFSEFLVVPVVLDVVQALQGEAESRGGSLSLIHSQNSQLKMNADPLRITQVVTNLVSNAIKYGNSGPIQVNISENHLEIILRVEDKGVGIDEEHLDRIFERFERVNDDPNITGLGLGLYITKHIVEAHEGRIEAKSKVGEGTQFTVFLPKKLA
jgi:signal transduction histidine kinase